MKPNSLKSAYRFGGTIFVLSVLIMSLIFGLFFRSCSNSDNVVNVHVTESKEKPRDTVFIEKIVQTRFRDTIRIPVMYKSPVITTVIPNKDTSNN
jgi:hypothetical protein